MTNAEAFVTPLEASSKNLTICLELFFKYNLQRVFRATSCWSMGTKWSSWVF